jgi:hypothetical protein
VNEVDESPGVFWTPVLERQVEAAEIGQPLDVGELEAGGSRAAEKEELRARGSRLSKRSFTARSVRT